MKDIREGGTPEHVSYFTYLFILKYYLLFLNDFVGLSGDACPFANSPGP
jgi:hypothetical protein